MSEEDLYIEVHILNGDALAHQLQNSLLKGQKIVFGEALIEGPINLNSFDLFLLDRLSYFESINEEFGDRYKTKHIPELKKLDHVDNASYIYLWFEYDLFCQVNLWYLLFLLPKLKLEDKIFWIKPINKTNWKGFGALSTSELENLINDAYKISNDDIELAHNALLNHISEASKMSKAEVDEPSILQEAIINAVSWSNDLKSNKIGSKPIDNIIRQLKLETNNNFTKMFQIFCSQYGYYGLGDLQFKNLLDHVNDQDAFL